DGTARPVVARTFHSFSQAAEENGQSRIYLGIHWAFDKTEGIRSGNRVADFVFDNFLQPQYVGGGAAAPGSTVVPGVPFSLTAGAPVPAGPLVLSGYFAAAPFEPPAPEFDALAIQPAAARVATDGVDPVPTGPADALVFGNPLAP